MLRETDCSKACNSTAGAGEALSRSSTEVGRTTFNVSSVASVIEAKAERAIKPEGFALGVVRITITALAALLIVGQIVGRQLRVGADDLNVLHALGASTTMTTVDGLVGVVGAIVLGSLLAVVVAVGLSGLAPIRTPSAG